jgi:hypothetical protein
MFAKVAIDVTDVIFECCGGCFRMLRNSSSCCTQHDLCCDDFFATIFFEAYSVSVLLI